MPRAKLDQKALFDRPRVERVAVEGARLVTIDADSNFWTLSNAQDAFARRVKGAIVRLRPPRDYPADNVARAREWLVTLALAVRVLPVRRSDVVPQAARAPTQKRSPRDVALELVAASSHPDREALRRRVEDRLTLVGL